MGGLGFGHLVGLLGLFLDGGQGGSELDGQLSEVHKCMLVCCVHFRLQALSFGFQSVSILSFEFRGWDS